MSKHTTTATWDDVPHLSAEAKAELFGSIPPYQRDARTKGIPQLGSGAIYQMDEQDIICRPFDIPDSWPRAFGLDVGWNRTAAIWGARDNASGVIYLYSEHYRAHDEPSVHVEAIKSRGVWIPGVIDPASRGRSQKDGTQLIQIYKDLGLDLDHAMNAVEAGIYACWQLMTAGKLKVFSSLSNWYSEFRLYRRDEDGKVVKEHDHAMDAFRYLIMSGRHRMRVKPRKFEEPRYTYEVPGGNSNAWMG
jgi:terminase large subunit-like protein